MQTILKKDQLVQEAELIAVEKIQTYVSDYADFDVLDGEEVIELRGENTKQFDLGENRYQAVIYPEPVHYRKAGQWAEIDNNLEAGEADDRRILKNRANSLICELAAEKDGGPLVRIRSHGHSLDWSFEETEMNIAPEIKPGQMIKREALLHLAAERRGNVRLEKETLSEDALYDLETPEERRMDLSEKTAQVQYANILPGITARYTLSGPELKEDLIVDDRSALDRVRLKLPPEYEYKINDDQSMSVLDRENGRERFFFDAPIVYDAKHVTTVARVRLTPCNGYTRLMYVLDERFLADCVFPITIDPVAKDRSTASSVVAKDVNEKVGTDTGESSKPGLRVGKNGDTKNYTTLLKFQTLALLKASDTVVSAKLKMTVGTASKSKNHYVGAYEVTRDWTISTPWSEIEQKIEDKSGIAEKPLDYAVGGKSTMTFDVTNLYREWYRADNNGGSKNFGIALKCMPNSQKYFSFCSPRHGTKSKRPLMTVNYVSHAGIESWWTYEQQSAGRAGTTYVDLFNGNVVHEHQDTAMSGARLPVSVAHYYNSCQSASEDLNKLYRCGMGWKHSGLQRIYEQKVSGKAYFVWVDGDGTEHWFRNNSRWTEVVTTDMEGMGLTLHRFCSTPERPPRVELTDQQHRKMIFQKRIDAKGGQWASYWLIRVEDPILDGKKKRVNQTKYTYDMPADTSTTNMLAIEGKLTKITDPAGRETRFTYNANGLLDMISIPDHEENEKRTVKFLYKAGSSNQLEEIKYSELEDHLDDGAKQTVFTYAAGTNLLTDACNYDGLTVSTEYERVNESLTGFDIDEDMDETEAEEEDGGNSEPVIAEGTINYELCRAVSLETKKVAIDDATNVKMRGAMQLFAYKRSVTEVTVVNGETPDAQDKKIIYQFNDKGNVIGTRDELGYAQFVSFDSGHENMPSSASKMQRAVVNRVRGVDLSSTSLDISISSPRWTVTNTNAFNALRNHTGNTGSVDDSANGQCLNLKSFRLRRRSANGTLSARQTIKLELGKVYTFSVYVKADDVVARTLGNLKYGGFARLSPETANAAPTVTGAQLTTDIGDDMGGELPTDGWERYHFVYDTTGYAGTTNVRLELVNDATRGTFWFAAPQLEEGAVTNSVNLLSNGDFLLSSTNNTYVGNPRQFPTDWKAGSDIDKELKKAKTEEKQNVLNPLVKEMGKAIGVKGRNTDANDPMPAALSGRYLEQRGVPRAKSMDTFFYQDVKMNGKKNAVFFLGGWGSGCPAPGSEKNSVCGFRMTAKFYCKPKGSSGYKWYTGKSGQVPFNSEWVGWQAAGGAIIAPNDFTAVRVYLVCKGQPNSVKFSNVFLFREEYGQTYQYDKSKRVTSTADLTGQAFSAQYDKQNNLISYRKPGTPKTDSDNNYEYKMNYGSDSKKKQHLLVNAKTPEGVYRKYTYDKYGNVVEQSTGDKSDKLYIRGTVKYDADGNYAVEKVDARGKKVKMDVNPRTGQLAEVTTNAQGGGDSAKEMRISYLYDTRDRLTRVRSTYDGKNYDNEYSYDLTHLKTVKHNTGGNAMDVVYSFEYDELGAQTKVSVGNGTDQTILSTNTYSSDRSHKLMVTEFGDPESAEEVPIKNIGKIENVYDEFDRLTGVKYDGEANARYTYAYGANGQVAAVTDHLLSRVHETDYDLSMRPKQSTTRTAAGSALYRATLNYDKRNNLVVFDERVADGSSGEYRTSYTYDKDDRTEKVQYENENHRVDYEYDGAGRMGMRSVTNGDVTRETSYSYHKGAQGKNSTTSLVKEIKAPKLVYSYEYDDFGNIVKERRTDNGVTKEIRYQYDKLGQLTRVDDAWENATWVYEYDRGGNILKKKKHTYTTGTPSDTAVTTGYTYYDPNNPSGNAKWKDQATRIGVQGINYDEIGNPLSYGAWRYEWEKGRQLKRMVWTDPTAETHTKTLVYGYDAAGLRVRKEETERDTIANSTIVTTHEYTLHGKLPVHVVKTVRVNGGAATSTQLHIYYDAQSRPAMAKYNNAYYTYVHNLQGDVVKLLDGDGNAVVEYGYDAWGRVVGVIGGSMAGTLGELNPFRYRGYVYDEETGLYYLRSRYYEPVWGRFLNADSLIGSVGQGLSHNLYDYCKNNAVNTFDPSGNIALVATTVVIGIFKALITGAVATGVGVGTAYLADSTYKNARERNTVIAAKNRALAQEVELDQKREDEKKYHLAGAIGDGSSVYAIYPLTREGAVNVARIGVTADFVKEGLIAMGHKEVGYTRVHIGILSSSRADAESLAGEFSTHPTEDLFERGKMIMPHFHARDSEEADLKHFHFWYMQ